MDQKFTKVGGKQYCKHCVAFEYDAIPPPGGRLLKLVTGINFVLKCEVLIFFLPRRLQMFRLSNVGENVAAVMLKVGRSLK